MTLTEEERQELLLRRSEAKVRCKEVWGTICELNRLLRSYNREHDKWRKKFEAADLTLAEHDKLTVVTVEDRRKAHTSEELIVKFSPKQIQEIIEKLGAKLK